MGINDDFSHNGSSFLENLLEIRDEFLHLYDTRPQFCITVVFEY
jgi:hypothetical protein